MYREIKATSQIAQRFALLEHILRVSILKKEEDAVLNTLSGNLKAKISELLIRKTNEAQQPLHELSTKVTLDELKNMPDPSIVVHSYKYDGKEVKLKVKEQEEGRLPVCHILKIDRTVYILYTPHMTTLDGFDCFTGNKIFPILTEEMMHVFSNGLYTASSGFRTTHKKNEKKPYVQSYDEESEDSIHDQYSQEQSQTESESEHSSVSQQSEASDLKAPESKNSSEIEDLTDSDSDQTPNEVKPVHTHKPKWKKPKIEKWKEVEKRILVERKQRDMCGDDCSII